jgi:hypothetical protein
MRLGFPKLRREWVRELGEARARGGAPEEARSSRHDRLGR